MFIFVPPVSFRVPSQTQTNPSPGTRPFTMVHATSHSSSSVTSFASASRGALTTQKILSTSTAADEKKHSAHKTSSGLKLFRYGTCEARLRFRHQLICWSEDHAWSGFPCKRVSESPTAAILNLLRRRQTTATEGPTNCAILERAETTGTPI